MTYLGRSDFGGGRALTRAETIERRVTGAIALSQILLVVRIMSVLLMVSFLPAHLPVISLRLIAGHTDVIPLSIVTGAGALMAVAVVSTLEMYLVYRLSDRLPLARSVVLCIEALAIMVCTTALALGAGVAVLPLGASAGSIGLLLLNQVRWAFKLRRAEQQGLTGRRQGGVFAGYAGSALDAPKGPQGVGYSASASPRD